MDVNQISQMITTVGFPIVAYLLFYFRMEKIMSANTEATNNNSKLIALLLAKEGVDVDKL